jgi:hypothetical protein
LCFRLIFTLTVTLIKVRTVANAWALPQQMKYYFSLYFNHLPRDFERREICGNFVLAAERHVNDSCEHVLVPNEN